ncbi:MAG: LacI family DNA-binding transcriptional regulator [Balneolaceae bacterium]
MEKLNIEKVAKLAHVSKSVVSRVLNDHPNVSDVARSRVLSIVKKYNYKPNSIAKNLAKNRSFVLSVLTDRRPNNEVSSGYWTLFNLGLFDECIKNGYFSRFSFVDTRNQNQSRHSLYDVSGTDGFILHTPEVINMIIDDLKENNFPVVFKQQHSEYSEYCSVDVNNYLGGYLATSHLLELGHENISILLAVPEVEEAKERFRGFRQAHSDKGIKVKEDLIITGLYSQEFGYEAVKKLLAMNQKFTALFCTSDTIAIGAILALNEEGIEIPEEVSVVGFDDLPTSKFTFPPLTTIHQPIYEKGVMAAKILINQLENCDSKIVHELLDPRLVIRKSTGPAPP